MRGTVVKRGPGYSIVLDVGPDPITGKRKQKRVSKFSTRKAAEAELARLISEVERGTFSDPGKLTVGEWLQKWVGRCSSELSPTTARGYRMVVEKHLIPNLGSIPLSKLRATHLLDYYTQAREDGRKNVRPSKGSALSGRTVLQHHRILHKAMREAEKMGLISRNPADLVDPPKAERRVPKVLTQDEVDRALDAVRGTYVYIPALLALATGARRGEILGLRWADVDLRDQMVYIRQELLKVGNEYVFRQPKTQQGVRPVPIPPAVVGELKSHQAQQKRWRLAAGSGWTESGLICTREDGTAINPDALSPMFIKLLERAGLPHVTFHGLRHTHATLLLQWNIHPKKVAERLGHSSTKLTMDTYSHELPTMQEEAVKMLEEKLFNKG